MKSLSTICLLFADFVTAGCGAKIAGVNATNQSTVQNDLPNGSTGQSETSAKDMSQAEIKRADTDVVYAGGVQPVEFRYPPPWEPAEVYNAFAEHCFKCHSQFREIAAVKQQAPAIYSAITGKVIPGQTRVAKRMPKLGENPNYTNFPNHPNGKLMIAFVEEMLPPVTPKPTQPTATPTPTVTPSPNSNGASAP